MGFMTAILSYSLPHTIYFFRHQVNILEFGTIYIDCTVLLLSGCVLHLFVYSFPKPNPPPVLDGWNWTFNLCKDFPPPFELFLCFAEVKILLGVFAFTERVMYMGFYASMISLPQYLRLFLWRTVFNLDLANASKLTMPIFSWILRNPSGWGIQM